MTGKHRHPSSREWLWVVLALVFVVIAPVATFIARGETGARAYGLIAAQAAAAGLAFLIPQWRQVVGRRRGEDAADRELAARVETRAAVNDALDPVLRQLGRISTEPSRPARRELIAQMNVFVLQAASNLIGPERSRACWFELVDGDPVSLVPRESVGRSGSPTTTFVEDTEAGDAAIGMVLNGETLLCEDIDTDSPPGWDSSKQRDYQTFISVSVTAADTAYGMLTLDALSPGDLNREDLRLLALMAAALASAIAQA